MGETWKVKANISNVRSHGLQEPSSQIGLQICKQRCFVFYFPRQLYIYFHGFCIERHPSSNSIFDIERAPMDTYEDRPKEPHQALLILEILHEILMWVLTRRVHYGNGIPLSSRCRRTRDISVIKLRPTSEIQCTSWCIGNGFRKCTSKRLTRFAGVSRAWKEQVIRYTWMQSGWKHMETSFFQEFPARQDRPAVAICQVHLI